MIWNLGQIAKTCLRTRMRDPRRNPDTPFLYVDISAIDRSLKVITSAPEILGADAPSRARKEIREGDVLVSTVRPNLNAVAVVPQHLDGQIASTGFCILRPNKSTIVGKYLFYFTTTPNFVGILSGKVRGAHYPAVSDSDVKEIELPLPTVSEQRRIVEILDQADALRKKRAEADAKAARILPALFYKMFGDPATNPKGWPVKRLGVPEVATVNPRFSGNDIPAEREFSFVPMADVDEVWGRIVGKQVRPYSAVMRGFTSFKDNDVLFAKITPCMQNGKAAIARKLVGGCGFGSTEFHILRAGPEATPEWLFALVRMAWFRRQAEGSFTGTAGQQRVPADFLMRYEVPCPPVDLQRAFAKAANRIFDWVNCSEQVRQTMDRLFSVILHRAFTSDLTAKWREAHMKELLAEMESQAKALDCPSPQSNSPEIGSKRHAGHDMFNKAALAAYITDRCHAPDRPMGRVKLAKLFYLVQQKAEIELTQTFMKRAAGPLDDEIHKFLSLAQKSKWLVLLRGEGDLKPVKPGRNVFKAIEQAEKLLGPAKATVDEMLDQMKGWGYRALERWATVLDASFELTAAGQPTTVEGVKDVIQKHPEWVPKLNRDEFSDTHIETALKGLRGFGFITNQD